MKHGRRVLLHPISAAATALSLALACAADASAQTAPPGGGAPSGGPSAPSGGTGAPSGGPGSPMGGPSGSGASTGGTLGGPSDPNPYYIGVSQAFTHDSNVYRVPDGPGDTFSSTSLLGGFDQLLGRQRLFGRAVVSGNRYQDETNLNNVSYSAFVGVDWETIEHLSGRVSGNFNRGLSSAPAGGSTPVTAQNIADTQTIEALIRWGGPSLLTLEGGASYSNVGYSSPQYVGSEFNKSSANVGLFYHGGGPFRVGIGVRADATRSPNAFVDPATGQVQSTRLNGQYVDLFADYDVTGQIVTNLRLSYTRQENSAGGTDLSGWTGALGVSWQVTSKTSLRVDAARDAGFNSTTYNTFAFTPTATGIAFTPVVGVFQNNQITASAGISANYAATAKISTFASARYYRAHQINVVAGGGAAAPDVIDIANTYSLGANYEITRNWGAACTMAYERREVSGGTNYTYDAKTIGCSTQFTWR
jgi:hypothetical protein